MKEYFYLQYLMINRKMKDSGIHPLVGCILGLLGFVLLSAYIFQKTEFAKYLVVLSCISLLLNISDNNRTDFLISTFGNYLKNKIRIIENVMISTPFVVLLMYKNAFIESIILFSVSLISGIYSYQNDFNFSTPTPFSKRPFEFLIGFRKTFYIFPIAYILTIIAINVSNFNLGIFSMVLVFLVSMGYIINPEQEYYVWIYSHTPKAFLKNKIITSTLYTTLLIAPIIISLFIFYPNRFEMTLLFFLIGHVFTWTLILAKYSAYPREINMPEGVMLAFCLYFPPMLLAILPFFYNKSINKLNVLLDDKN